MDLIRNLNRVAIWLAIDVKEDSGFSIRRHDRIYGLNVRSYRRNVTDAHRYARGRGLNDSIRDLFGSAHLPIDESEKELTVACRQAWGVHQIGARNRVQDIGHGHAGGEQLRGIGCYLELGFLAALND